MQLMNTEILLENEAFRTKIGQKKSNLLKVRRTMRRGRDSNPRYPLEVYTLSRRAPSTTRTPLLILSCKEINKKQFFQMFYWFISPLSGSVSSLEIFRW